MSSPLPPPPSSPGPPVGEFSNAGAPSAPQAPAPPQPPPASAQQDLMDVANIMDGMRSLSARHPQAVPLLQQMSDLMQQLQMQVLQSSPPTQVPAPPV